MINKNTASYSNHKSQLESAIWWLEQLIERKEKDEAFYQEFFEQNQIVFNVLGYRTFYSFTKESGRQLPGDEYTGLKPEPDFIVERENGLFEVFEIKTPFLKSQKPIIDSNKYRERFTAEVSNYISQTITYEKYFTRNPQNRQRVKRHYEIDIQEDLDIKIVVGLNPQVDKVKVHQKVRELKYKVDIITYDEILERLIREHDHIYGRHDDLTGYSFHFIVRFRSLPARRKKYFLDVRQNIDSNRVSLYLDEHDRIRFMAIDNTGRRYEVEIDTEEVKLLNEWIYLVCEFGGDNSGFAMSISFNGFEVDKRLKDTAVNLPISLTNATIGCSVDQKEFGRFDLGETIIYTHKLSFRDKLQLLGYIIRKYGESVDKVDYYWEYDGSKFMYMKENGNWIQEKDEHKPILRKTKGVIK